MKKVLFATTAITLAATSAFAADMKGEIALDMVKDANDKFVATPSIEMGVDGEVGVGSIGLIVDGNDNIKLDTYSLGVKVGEATVSFGDQGDLMEAFEGSTEAVGGQTLTDLDDDGESIMVQTGNIGVMVGFDDIGTDVSDIKNVQVGAGAQIGVVAVAGAVNWDQASEDITVGLNAQMNYNAINLGGTVTYTEAVTGFELSAGYGNFGAFLNGDENDMAQNIGGGYYGDTGAGLTYYGEVGYNIDTEELTPAAGVKFNF